MVKFVAYGRVDMTYLSELGRLADSGPIESSHGTPTDVVLTQGNAPFNVDFHIHGNHFQYRGGIPYTGNVTSLLVTVNGVDAYQFSHFNYPVMEIFRLLDQPPNRAISQIMAGNDNITGSPFDDVLGGYAGKDIIHAGAGNDVVKGGTGDDRLYGEDGADSLVGGPGNDRLFGGTGNDALNGGPGLDRFEFDTALDGTNNVDTISGFSVLQDHIVLHRSIFDNLGAGTTLSAAEFHVGPVADAPGQRILYDSATGDVSFDRDGNGPIAPVRFAVLAPNLALHEDHFLLMA